MKIEGKELLDKLASDYCPSCDRETLQLHKQDNMHYCYCCGNFLVLREKWVVQENQATR